MQQLLIKEETGLNECGSSHSLTPVLSPVEQLMPRRLSWVLKWCSYFGHRNYYTQINVRNLFYRRARNELYLQQVLFHHFVSAPSTKVKPTESTWSAPLIVTPPKNVTAERGDNITLSCAAVGYPKPKIRYQQQIHNQFYNMINSSLYVMMIQGMSKNWGLNGIRTLTSALPVQCSTSWAIGWANKKNCKDDTLQTWWKWWIAFPWSPF